jgi:hypothetical protein
LIRSRWFSVVALVFVLVLAPALDRDKLAWAVLAFLGLVGTYGSIIQTFDMGVDFSSGVLELDILSAIRAIAYRTISVLTVIGVSMVLASPQISISIAKSIAVGAAKAAHWMALFSVVSQLRVFRERRLC